MVTQFTCTCGNCDPNKVYYYDGALGYEALICTVCGAYYDHVGSGGHQPDEWSRQFIGGETRPKTFRTEYNIGRVKYAVSFHNGCSTHKDGSPFYDIRIFKNKKKMEAFIRDLRQIGYQEQNAFANYL
jgi:hypothetical protein